MAEESRKEGMERIGAHKKPMLKVHKSEAWFSVETPRCHRCQDSCQGELHEGLEPAGRDHVTGSGVPSRHGGASMAEPASKLYEVRISAIGHRASGFVCQDSVSL